MNTDNFEPAFPILDDAGSGLHLRHGGMDLRDYFAAKALMAMGHFYIDAVDDATIAAKCYEMADAMMEARNAK